MGLRGFVRRRVADRISPTGWGAIVIAGGGALTALGRDGPLRLVTVGVLYLAVGVGLTALHRRAPGRVAFGRARRAVFGALGVAFAVTLAVLAWRRATIDPLGPTLVLRVLPVAVERFLEVAPIGLLALVGIADRRREREYAVPALVVTVAFVVVLELLGGYRGFGWPILPVVLTLAWLLLVLVLGAPLFVFGVLLGAASPPGNDHSTASTSRP